MRCPKCQSNQYILGQPCPQCQFDHDILTLEKLSNVNYLLGELREWSAIPRRFITVLENRYIEYKHTLEIEIGVRQRPLKANEAAVLREELLGIKALLEQLPIWAEKSWITPTAAEEQEVYYQARQQEIEHALSNAPPPPYTPRTHLALTQYNQLSILVESLYQNDLLLETGYEQISADLADKIAELEIRLGLREAPAVPQTAVEINLLEPKPVPTSPRFPPPPPKSTRPPREPISWDKVWDTLLSEKTLKAVLFLAVALLVGGAISIVVNEWDNFSRFAQAAFLGGFTAVFYALGWYVRRKMHLEGSGLALTAVASLLVPLDFYTYYISGGFPEGSWPTVWLVASAVCLVAYSATVYLMHSEMFGYLVPLAAGSLALALSNWFDLATHWWVLSFTAVPLLLALASTYLTTPPHNLVQRPFRHLSLAFSVPVLIIESAVWALNGFGSPAFALAIGLSWWLTTIILLLAIRPYPLQLTVLGALFAFPVGLWLNQSWFVQVYGWHWAWHAAGFALLTPLYIILGWWVKQKEQTWQFELKSFGFIKRDRLKIDQLSEMILAVAWLLALIAGGLSLGRVAVIVPVHSLLAASFLLIAILWQRPRVLWAMSFLLLTASAAWQGYRGASPVELTLPWALLAIIHVIAAVRLPDRHLAYRQVLNQAAVLLAAFALLPPIPLFDAAMMSYALLNWIGITGWLAYLYHTPSWSISTARNHNTETLNISLLLQWLAALPIMPWLLLVTRNESVALRTMLIAGATWLLLALSLRLRKADWGYRRPWQMATHLTAFAVLGLAHTGGFEAPELLAMTAVAAFYFTAAPLYKNRWWLMFAALLVPYIITQRFFGVQANPYDLMIVLGLLTLVYISVGYLLQRAYATDSVFLKPLFWATHLLTMLLLLLSGVMALFAPISTSYGIELPKVALSVSAITAAYLLYAWLTNRQFWAHTAVWLFVFAGSLFVIAYSRGSGLSAFLVALLSFAYIFGERQLSQAARHKIDPIHNPYGAAWRKGWLLFRLPLHTAGWILSAVAILAALVRNLNLLDAGTEQYLWSIATLLTITILYGLSAHWFKQVVFVYFSSLLWVTTWTVATDLIHISWLDMTRERWFGISWAVCAFTLLAAALAIAEKTPFFWRNFKQKETAPTLDKFSGAPQIVAHLLLPFALVANTRWLGSVAVTFALAAVFYTIALLIDRRYRPVSEQWLGRFLYPAVVALIMATLNGVRFAVYPAGSYTTDSIVLIAYAFPLLWLGRYLSRLQPQYGLPLYLTSYGVTLLALAFAVPEQPLFTLYLFIAAAQTLLSAIWFKQPLWLYPMSFLLFIGTISGLDALEFAIHEVGWGLILLGAAFFLSAAVLRQQQLGKYAAPLLEAAFITTIISLMPTAFDRTGALVGYSMVSLIYIIVAMWLQKPLLLNLAVPLAAVPYAIAADNLGVPQSAWALAMWPAIFTLLLVGRWLDDRWGWVNHDQKPYPWNQPLQWAAALIDRLRFWWAFPLYYTGLTAVFISPLFAIGWSDSGRTALVLGLGAAVFIWAMYRFRLRIYLFTAALWVQFAALSLMIWFGYDQSAEQVVNLFSPILVLTAALAVLIEHTLQEGALFYKEEGSWRLQTAGWSRALYLLLTFNLFVNSMIVLITPTSGLAVLVQTLLLAFLATWWLFPALAFLAEATAVFTVLEYGSYISAAIGSLPIALAVIALVYGGLSYGATVLHHKYIRWPEQVLFWTRPLQIGSWVVSLIALLTSFGVAAAPGVDAARMFIAVFAILGLLYLTIALVEQKPRVGYGALLLLLMSWSMWLLLIQQENEIQLYALPASTYLLGIGWMEWRLGNKRLAGWIDRVAFVLLIGSALWQSFGDWGGLYALLLIAEGLVLVWIGSMRHMRRHLYIGVMAVLLAIVSQILEPLFNLNAFILLLLGAALTIIGIGLERRLEAVRVLSKEFRTRLEDWD